LPASCLLCLILPPAFYFFCLLLLPPAFCLPPAAFCGLPPASFALSCLLTLLLPRASCLITPLASCLLLPPATDYYQLCRTHHGILSQFLHPEAQIAPIEKKEPIKSNGKSSRYLFEYELRMLLGVFSTCWAKNYKRSEGWIYKR
jgi:hypothetical protein